MASYSVIKAKHATFSTTVADTVSFTQSWNKVEIVNRDGANLLYYTTDGTVPVAAADNTSIVTSNSSVIETGSFGVGLDSLKLVGSGGAYSVVAIQ